MSDEDYEGIGSQAALAAMVVIEALEVAEVQEALTSWSKASFELIRAFERADLPHPQIAGIMSGGIVETLARMQNEDRE